MRVPVAVVLLLSMSAARLEAQATADRAQLVLTVAAGFRGGSSLWQVDGQALDALAGGADRVSLTRDIQTSLGVMFAGTYFPGEHLGFTGEALLLGLGSEDGCTITQSTGDADNRDFCSLIDHSSRGGTAVAVSAGLIYRVVLRSGFSPYVRGNLGATLTQQSFIKTSATVNTNLGPALRVVLDDHSSRQVHPYVSFGAGFTAAFGRGYQVRLEARDNYLTLPIPTAPTIEGSVPKTGTKGLHLFSFMLGFDVVLEKRRGKRY